MPTTAVVLSISSAGLLAWICLDAAGRSRREWLLRIIFALFGWLALAPLLWAHANGFKTLLAWGREHQPWGTLLFMAVMQLLPYTAVMSFASFSSIIDFLTRKTTAKAAQASMQKWNDAQSAETHDKNSKVLLVGSSDRFVALCVLACIIIAATICLYENIPSLGRYFPAKAAIILVTIGCVYPFRKIAYHVCKLTLANRRLRVTGVKGDILDLPVSEIEYYRIGRFRPKGFGFLLRVQGSRVNKSLWFLPVPGEVVDGYRGFTLDKLNNDIADMDSMLRNAPVAKRIFLHDTFLCALPMIIIIGILLFAVAVLAWALLRIFTA